MQVLAIWGFFALIAILSNLHGKSNYITNVLVYLYGLMAVYAIVQQILYNEDKYKGIYFMKTLPLKESMIVDNKFVTVIVLDVLSFVVSFMLLGVIGIVTPQNISLMDIIMNILILVSVNLAYCGILLLLFFCVGPAKSRQYMSFIVIILILAISLGPSLIQGTAAAEYIKDAIKLLDQPYTPFAFLLVGPLIYAACWAASLRVFKRKSYIS
jgi:hypothetical protein